MLWGKHRILEKSPENSEDNYDFDQDDKIFHSLKFKSTNEKIKIGTSVQKLKESKETKGNDDDKKKYYNRFSNY